MIDNLNAKFDRTGLKNFLNLGAILSLLCDILNVAYILVSYLPVAISTVMLQQAMAPHGIDLNTLAAHEVDEIRSVFIQTFTFVFVIVLFLHAGIYFMMARNKKWAKNYVYGYSILGALLTLLILPMMITQLQHYVWAVVMFATTFIYLYIFLGLKHFKKTEEQ
jgi:hypothetical protein